MKTLMMILGNGITIDMINRLQLNDKIDPQNLFRKGDLVPWPDGQNEVGFLSYKFCRSLWSIGARPYMNKVEANELIEDIISCANMAPDILHSSPNSNNIYINAYYELAAYLKQLFVCYNKIVPDVMLSRPEITDWGWYKLLKQVYTNSEYERVIIITYNYDVFLERILSANNIPFDISLISENNNKIKIVKPHGSISFAHNVKGEREAYQIRKSADMNEAKVSDFHIDYQDMDNNYLVSALIPPSGDSSRLTYKWASEMREEAQRLACSLSSNDKLIISGLSYWHVDRKEIDELLISVNHDIHVYLVNPEPPRALSAVLSCIFDNFIVYTNSSILGDIL